MIIKFLFRFQTGSIKRVHTADAIYALFVGFDSKLVRLKE